MPTAAASPLDRERSDRATELSGEVGFSRGEIAEWLGITPAALAASLSRVRAEKNRRILAALPAPEPPAPESEPEPEPAPPTPLPGPRAATPPVAAPERPVPPMTRGAAGAIRDATHLAAVTDAYYGPVTRTDQDDRFWVQWSTTVRLVVAKDTGYIVNVEDHEEGVGAPTLLADRRATRRRKPSAGTGHRGHLPRTVGDLLERCADEGCGVKLGGGGHYKITRGSKTVTVPATPSEYRSIPNACSQLQTELGIDLRRGGSRGAASQA